MVVACLFCGYFGREFCTLHLYTTSKLWQAESLVDDKGYSFMLGVGHVVGASAKIGFGVLAGSVLHGRTVFIVAALGAAALTLLFGIVSTPVEFFIVWLVMHVFIPGCWVGLVGVVAENVAAKRVGKTMAFLSLAYVGGDACVRTINGYLLKIDGFGWRGVFLFGGTVGVLFTLPAYLFIKAKAMPRADANQTDAKPRSKDAKQTAGNKQADTPAPRSRMEALKALLGNMAFLLLCLLSFMLRAVRSFFLSFTVPFLVDVSCRSANTSPSELATCLASTDANSKAVLGSVLFPLTGVLSTVLCGYLKDRMGARHRAWIPILFLSISFLSLAQLALLGASTPWPVALASLVACGFGLFGPYTLLAGAFAIDVGGEGGAATASALIDSAGTVGSISMVALKGSFGSDWVSIFSLLAAAVAFSVTVSMRLLMLDRSTHPKVSKAKTAGSHSS